MVPRTRKLSGGTRSLALQLVLLVTLAAASRACLINPQKDYPVGSLRAGVGGEQTEDGAAGQGSTAANGGAPQLFPSGTSGTSGSAGVPGEVWRRRRATA